MDSGTSYYKGSEGSGVFQSKEGEVWRDLLRATAKAYPNKECLVCYEENYTRHSITYKKLDETSDVFAKALLVMGFQKDDVIGMMVRNSTTFVVLQMALCKIGCISLMLNAQSDVFTSNDVAKAMLDEFLCKGVFTDKPIKDVQKCEIDIQGKDACDVMFINMFNPDNYTAMSLAEVQKLTDSVTDLPEIEITPEDNIGYFLTSGSSGYPKLVPRDYKGLSARSLSQEELNYIRSMFSDRPMTYIGGFGCIGQMCVGYPIVGLNSSKLGSKDNLDLIVHILKEEKIQVATLLGYLLNDILGLPELLLPDLKFVTTGGQLLSDKLEESFKKQFPVLPILQYYGSSEGGAISVGSSLDPNCKWTSSGKVLGNVEVKVINDDGEMVLFGEIGEICVRGHGVFKGYVGTSKNLPNPISSDGWYRTDDEGFLTPEGYLTVLGRKDDIIKRATLKVAPVTIEKYINKHPSVEMCIVVGVNDERMGQEICACVLLQPEGNNEDEKTLDKWWHDQVNSGAIPSTINTPKYYWIVDSLPKNTSYKIDRRKLTKLANENFNLNE